MRAAERGDAPGRNRTYDLALRRRTLYPLSYRREFGSSKGLAATFGRLTLYTLSWNVLIVPAAGQVTSLRLPRRLRPSSVRVWLISLRSLALGRLIFFSTSCQR